jgi:formylmethanofuran dehydrogenase subunit E
MNVICLTGNLCKDVELKYTKNNKRYSENTIAVQKGNKNQNGEYETDFIDIVVFEQNPKTIIIIPKISKSIYPMCQICNEMMIFEMKDYKIICRGCKNGHLVNLFINEYEDFQKNRFI